MALQGTLGLYPAGTRPLGLEGLPVVRPGPLALLALAAPPAPAPSLTCSERVVVRRASTTVMAP